MIEETSTSSSLSSKGNKVSLTSSVKRFFQRSTLKKPEKLESHTSLFEADSPFAKFEKVFQFFDKNGDGKISPIELKNGMRFMGEKLSPKDASEAIEWSDSDGDRYLGFEDFVKLIDVKEEQEKEKDLREAFRRYASDGSITPKSLKKMLGRLGEKKSIEVCKVMIHKFDVNGDGVLSFDEFQIMMQ